MSADEYAALLREIDGLKHDLAQHKHNVVDSATMSAMPRMLVECSRMEQKLGSIEQKCEGHRPAAGALT